MNHLGWIRAPDHSLGQWDQWTALAAAARADGLDRPLVCGMGGSSLTAHVLATSGGGRGGRQLDVLDSTDPAAVLAAERACPLARLLVLSVSKSGTTVETQAFCAGLADGARAGRDKLVLRPPAPLGALAAWVEQLVAESSGQDGCGVVP